MGSVVQSIASGSGPGGDSRTENGGQGDSGASADAGSANTAPDISEGSPAPGGKGGMPWLRIAATVILIAGLVYVFDAKAILQRLASIDRLDAALAFAVLCVQYLTGAGRWHYILRRHDISLSLLNSLAIYGSASLANAVVSHSVVGLSVKGLMLKGQGAATSRMLGVLLIERLAAAGGLAVCFLISLALAFRHLGGILESPDERTAIAAVIAVAVLAAAGFVMLRMSTVRNFAREIRSSFLKTEVILLLVLLSAAIVYLGFFSIVLLAWGMGITISVTDLMIVLPLVAFAAALPVSLGGWGVREGMMVATLALFDVPADAALALSIIYGLIGTVVAALLGGLSAVLFPIRRGDIQE